MIDVFGPPQDRTVFKRVVAAARETLGEDAFAAAEAAGRALTFDALLDALLAALDDGKGVLATPVLGTSQARQPDSLLSPREREVLALLAEGRSNKAIAEVLFVSPNTVKAHVSALLDKLDADNRAQLAIIAVQRGLLSD